MLVGIYFLRVLLKTPKEEITNKIIIDNRDFLLSLLNKKSSFMHEEFIPYFLEFLEEHVGNKYPPTSKLLRDVGCDPELGLPMILSEEGKVRWQQAIKENKKFEPFKDFGILKSYMTEEQQEKLNTLVEKRNILLKESSNYSVEYSKSRFFSNVEENSTSDNKLKKDFSI